MKNRLNQDQGVAIVSVVLLGLVATVVIALLALRAVRNTDEALAERERTEAINAAESGLEVAVFELNENSSFFTVPTSYGAPTLGDPVAERDWVLAAVTDLGLAGIDSGGGEYAIVKPEGMSVVYSAGFVPSITDARSSRVVKYQFNEVAGGPPAGLGQAFLSGGGLIIPGSPEFNGTDGNLHVNGDLSASGSPIVAGYASAGGSYSGGFIVGDPANSGATGEIKSVPLVEPNSLHGLSQYDMCNNGDVRAGPAHPGGGGATPGSPCTGAYIADGGGTYRGFKHGGHEGDGSAKWSYGTADKYDGVYFFDGGSVKMSQSPGKGTTPWKATLLINPVGGYTCGSNAGGDFNVSGSPYMIPHPSAEPWLVVAGRDAKMPGSAESYGSASSPGLITIGEQIEISGSPDIYGAFIANGACDTPGSMLPFSQQKISGSPTFNWNGEFGIPGTSSSTTITNFRWSEL